MKQLALSLALALALLAPVALAVREQTFTQSYVGTAPSANAASSCPASAVPNPGATCFRVPAVMYYARVRVTDAVLGSVGGRIIVDGASPIEFCEEGTTIPVPAGAVFLRVFVNEKTPDDGCANAVSGGTTGTVTVTFF